MAGAKSERTTLQVAGREVAITNPGKIYFPEAGITKLDVAQYYMAVADGALRGAGGRPNVLVRYADGIHGEFFYQKRAPAARPDWVEGVELRFPSGGVAEEIVPRDAAALVWMANLGCLELHPHPVRAEDLEHPDELRIDLDPVPGVEWSHLVAVAEVVRGALGDLGLVGWPKTSGSRGIHVNVRIHRRVVVRGGAARRAGAGAGGGAPGPDARHQQVVEGGAPRRLPRLQPERQGPHGLQRLLRASEAGRARLGARHVGRARPVRPRRLHAPHDARALRRDRRPARRHRRGRVLARLAAGAVPSRRGRRGWATRRGRLTTGSSRASPIACAPSKRKSGSSAGGRRVSTKPLIEIGRADRKEEALAGLERWKQRHPEAARHLEPADVLVDSMRGRSTTWTRVRVNLEHVPEALRPAQEPLDPDGGPSWASAPGRPAAPEP